jgi:hypothetical protein
MAVLLKVEQQVDKPPIRRELTLTVHWTSLFVTVHLMTLSIAENARGSGKNKLAYFPFKLFNNAVSVILFNYGKLTYLGFHGYIAYHG